VARRAKIAVAMTIAGSDPSGGAGLQADLKTFAALKVYGYSVVTAVTVQNSAHVARVEPLAADLVTAQIETLLAERRPDAIKTGALGSAAVVEAIAELIRAKRIQWPVVDPVLISSSGARLIDARGEYAMREHLIPLAQIVTPNIPEAAALSGITIDSMAAMRAAARAIRRMGARYVVIKGGHPMSGAGHPMSGVANGARNGVRVMAAIDLLYGGREFVELRGPWITGGGAHGTGCAFSAALAAWLARGAEIETAVRRAKTFVARALRHGFTLGTSGRLLDLSASPRTA
jgi:hydroxymethylpyrimidine/phosphomethylpyrimidine kinase